MSQEVSLTIAIPTYNRSHTVSKLVEALQGQLRPNEELLVVDDGSLDNTCHLLSTISGVRLHRHKSNQGMVKTWNACLQLASNQWICIIHDDDILCEGALQAIRLACLVADGPALIIHKPVVQSGANQFNHKILPPGSNAVFCSASATVPSGAVVHRDIVDALGKFDEGFLYSTDIEYFARISSEYKLVVIEAPAIVDYQLHDDNYQYRTWLKSDFYPQLLEIEKRVISYAGLYGIDATDRFAERVVSYLIYIVNQAERIKNRRLMRRYGFLLCIAKGSGRRTRFKGLTTVLRSWLPFL